MKLAKITKQLEALQSAMQQQANKVLPDQSGSANSQNGQHNNDDDKDDDTEAERQETFGKSN